MNPKNRLAEKSLDLYKLKGIYNMLFYIIIILVGSYFVYKFGGSSYYYLLGIPLIVHGIYKMVIFPIKFTETFRYEVVENKINLISGAIIISKINIPLFRVQHIQTSQGPLLKKFGLAQLTIHTAGSVYHIPSLKENIAEELREEIVSLTKEIDE